LLLARRIAANGPLAVRLAKTAISRGMECTTLAEGMAVEAQAYAGVLKTADRREALQAFLAKRPPVFRGE